MDPREWLFDKRVLRRNLDKGVVSVKVLNEYLGELPDLEGEISGLEFSPHAEQHHQDKGA